MLTSYLSDKRVLINNISINYIRTQKNCLKLENIFVELTKSTKRINSANRKRAEFPDGFETEPDVFRKQILRAETEVKEIECNIEALEYRIPSLLEEQKLLSKEAAKYPDEEVILKANLFRRYINFYKLLDHFY